MQRSDVYRQLVRRQLVDAEDEAKEKEEGVVVGAADAEAASS